MCTYGKSTMTNKEVKTPVYLGKAMQFPTINFNELCIRYWKHIYWITFKYPNPPNLPEQVQLPQYHPPLMSMAVDSKYQTPKNCKFQCEGTLKQGRGNVDLPKDVQKKRTSTSRILWLFHLLLFISWHRIISIVRQTHR